MNKAINKKVAYMTVKWTTDIKEMCYLAYVSILLIIINLINVVLSYVPYHSHFLTYQTRLSLL